MRQAKRCGCSFQQSAHAVAGERIRVNATSGCGRNSYTCQNRCQPKPCAPRPCEKVCRPRPCTPHCNDRPMRCRSDFEASYYQAMGNPYRYDGNMCDGCDDDWYDDCADNWCCDDRRCGNGYGYDCRPRYDCGCDRRRPHGKDDCDTCDNR